MPTDYTKFQKPSVMPHPKVLAQMDPKDRPKKSAPVLDKTPSLGAMRQAIIAKKPEGKEVMEYFKTLIEKVAVDAPDDLDD